jgi:hypothetical protein
MYMAPRYHCVLLPALLLLACSGQLDHVGLIPDPNAPAKVPDAGPQPAPTPPGAVTPAPTSLDSGALPDVGGPAPPATPPAGPPPAAPPPTPRPRTALFVVGNPANLSPADERTEEELEKLTFAVTVADDAGPATAANGLGIVVISASAADATVAGKFKDSATPVVVLESFIYDDMGMTDDTANTDFGAANGTQIAIAAGDNPLAAGLTGNVAIVTAAAAIHWGVPGSGGKLVAALANNQQRAALFSYEKGAAMVGLMAPARRVGLFASQTATDRLNANGLKLFAAAIEWAWTESNNVPE